MAFELVRPSIDFIHSNEFWTKLKVGRKEEGSYLKKLFSIYSKKKTNITLLVNDNYIFGLIALFASRIEDLPSVQVDYLFVSKQYRKLKFEELDNMKISEFLINYAISTSVHASSSIGIKYVLLLPAHDSLISIYANMDFKRLHSKTNWMIYKIA